LKTELEALEAAPLYLTTSDCLRVCCLVEGRPHLIVGGQALNFWAEHYCDQCAELSRYRPFTSKDIDFFGKRELGQFLADGLGAKISVPDVGRETPNTAVVITELNGRSLVIDVLNHVLGVPTAKLALGQVELEFPFETEDGLHLVRLVLMHPLHCFISRAVSVHHPAIRRQDQFVQGQLRASLWVLAAFLDDIANSDIQLAGRWARELAYVLTKHPQVLLIDVQQELDFDPLEILIRIGDDPRFDLRFREHQIAGCIAKVHRARRLQNGRNLSK
jgi:hypothetical protein